MGLRITLANWISGGELDALLGVEEAADRLHQKTITMRKEYDDLMDICDARSLALNEIAATRRPSSKGAHKRACDIADRALNG